MTPTPDKAAGLVAWPQQLCHGPISCPARRDGSWLQSQDWMLNWQPNIALENHHLICSMATCTKNGSSYVIFNMLDVGFPEGQWILTPDAWGKVRRMDFSPEFGVDSAMICNDTCLVSSRDSSY